MDGNDPSNGDGLQSCVVAMMLMTTGWLADYVAILFVSFEGAGCFLWSRRFSL